jgi:hypothetical protein
MLVPSQNRVTANALCSISPTLPLTKGDHAFRCFFYYRRYRWMPVYDLMQNFIFRSLINQYNYSLAGQQPS